MVPSQFWRNGEEAFRLLIYDSSARISFKNAGLNHLRTRLDAPVSVLSVVEWSPPVVIKAKPSMAF